MSGGRRGIRTSRRASTSRPSASPRARTEPRKKSSSGKPMMMTRRPRERL